MIKRKFYKIRKDGTRLIKTCSDQNVKIRKVGTDEIYDTAIDVLGSGFKYEEIDDYGAHECPHCDGVHVSTVIKALQ